MTTKKMRSLEDLVAAKKEYDDGIKAAGNLIDDSLRKFLDDHPEVFAITVKGYVPSFNDGDPCTFGLHETEVYLVKDKPDDEEETEEWLSEEGQSSYGKWDGKTHRKSQVHRDLEKLHSALETVEDAVQARFGDGFRATLRSDQKKIVVEDYGDY